MLTKEQLLSKRNELVASIKTMEATEFAYVIPRPYQQFGNVAEMEQNELIQAFAKLKSQNNDFSQAAAELGFDCDSLDTPLCGGYSYDEWKADMMTRSAELKAEVALKKAKTALEIIENHLSEDDKFALAMSQVDELLS